MAKAKAKERRDTNKSRRDHQVPVDRSDAPREDEPRGEVVPDKGGSGAPQGGRIDGRHGDQEGIRY
jgi:hypothetical protein